MKKSFVEAWLSALRSGEYKQGAGTLYNELNGSYCCLGVLCKVTNIDITQAKDNYEPFSGWLRNYKPPGVMDVVGTLWGMNDGTRDRIYSFPEIADWIEANILPNATEE